MMEDLIEKLLLIAIVYLLHRVERVIRETLNFDKMIEMAHQDAINQTQMLINESMNKVAQPMDDMEEVELTMSREEIQRLIQEVPETSTVTETVQDNHHEQQSTQN